jgi:hypothetical protein
MLLSWKELYASDRRCRRVNQRLAKPATKAYVVAQVDEMADNLSIWLSA